MEFNQFVVWAFEAILCGCAIYAVQILSKMSTSIDELNLKVAIVIEKTSYHEKMLDKHEAQIEALGRKRHDN